MRDGRCQWRARDVLYAVEADQINIRDVNPPPLALRGGEPASSPRYGQRSTTGLQASRFF